ncbi:MAG: Hpt domain-containing protein [Aestuariibacter sp.]
MLIELRQKFVRSLLRYHEQINKAVQQNDEDLLEDQLHELKGVCGNFEFETLTKLVEECHTRLREHDPSLTDMLPNLLAELQKVMALHKE